MKFMVVGDIHGSILAANKIQEVMQKGDITACLILGDILYHGPRNPILEEYKPKEVVEILNRFKTKIIAVKGNCDSEVDQMVLEFPITSSSNQLFLKERKVLITHGHLTDIEYKEVLQKGDVLICGHSHLLQAEYNNDIYFLNAGSLSLPKEKNPCTYGILSEEGFIIYDKDNQEVKSIQFE